MCGIAGLVSSERLDLDAPHRVARMRDVIAHRGPDDCGLYCDGQAALGHRRLSIVDLATGQQPLSNEARDVSQWSKFGATSKDAGIAFSLFDLYESAAQNGRGIAEEARQRGSTLVPNHPDPL